ncbi:hypothetical protein [Streptomyces sp. NPDC050564]|uniref:hypothetical protein n=1 Tax=Streptomyces sp. NPDC050564 TaxID=3365631 RepID=UPI00379F47AE
MADPVAGRLAFGRGIYKQRSTVEVCINKPSSGVAWPLAPTDRNLAEEAGLLPDTEERRLPRPDARQAPLSARTAAA